MGINRLANNVRMKKLLMGSVMLAALGLFVISLPSPTTALQFGLPAFPTPPTITIGDIHGRFAAQLDTMRGQICRNFPNFCPPAPPPPVDICPNVPGNQTSGPCADVECTEDGGTWNGNSCVMPPSPEPILIFSATPGVIDEGDSSLLAWNSEHTDSCTASDGWSGEKLLSGNESVEPTITTIYTLTCGGEGGEIAASTTVTVTPAPPEGHVVINEIMYDPSGGDTGHEWIEIRNGTSQSFDLLNWKFFENNSNHGLTLIAGSATLLAGDFAIIADNATTFLTDWPSFSGTLFDSAFSLSNTAGEMIALKNPALEIIDALTYATTTGANGDGNSLHRTEGGNWIAALPTPGAENAPDASPNSL